MLLTHVLFSISTIQMYLLFFFTSLLTRSGLKMLACACVCTVSLKTQSRNRCKKVILLFLWDDWTPTHCRIGIDSCSLFFFFFLSVIFFFSSIVSGFVLRSCYFLLQDGLHVSTMFVCVLVEAFVSITVKKKGEKKTLMGDGKEGKKKALGSNEYLVVSFFSVFFFSIFHPKRMAVFFFFLPLRC